MKYKCPHCKEEVNESHMCKSTRAIHGEMVGTLTHYHANIGKVNKQTVFGVGYMKHFGSKSSQKIEQVKRVEQTRNRQLGISFP